MQEFVFKKIVQNSVRNFLKTKLFVTIGDFGELPASAWREAYQNPAFFAFKNNMWHQQSALLRTASQDAPQLSKK
jgi:hypothetical protein